MIAAAESALPVDPCEDCHQPIVDCLCTVTAIHCDCGAEASAPLLDDGQKLVAWIEAHADLGHCVSIESSVAH